MSNISERDEFDLSAIAPRATTAEEWEALKREVVRRAHAERTNMVREFLARLRSLWRAPRQRIEVLRA